MAHLRLHLLLKSVTRRAGYILPNDNQFIKTPLKNYTDMENWTNYVDSSVYTPVIMNDVEEGYYTSLYDGRKYSIGFIVAMVVVTTFLWPFFI